MERSFFSKPGDGRIGSLIAVVVTTWFFMMMTSTACYSSQTETNPLTKEQDAAGEIPRPTGPESGPSSAKSEPPHHAGAAWWRRDP